MFNFLSNWGLFDKVFPDNLFSFWFFGEPKYPTKNN